MDCIKVNKDKSIFIVYQDDIPLGFTSNEEQAKSCVENILQSFKNTLSINYPKKSYSLIVTAMKDIDNKTKEKYNYGYTVEVEDKSIFSSLMNPIISVNCYYLSLDHIFI